MPTSNDPYGLICSSFHSADAMPHVNPAILVWARETADLTPEEAARRIGLRDSGKGTAVERLRALESGEEAPTRSMLSRMAKQYRRPLLAFYLPEPPRKGDRGEDFRTLPADYVDDDEALVDALLRDVKVRQSLVRAALEDEDDAEPVPWVGAHSKAEGVREAVAALEGILRMTHRDYRTQSGPDAAFRLTRAQAEEAGVFVLLMGNLGSYHTNIDPEVFRGFALADEVAPFVVINDQDARSAWSFTLLHEVVHLMVGATGISAGIPARGVEQFCNSVASAFLVPEADIEQLSAVLPPGPGDRARTLGEFSRRWNVSRSLLAYRLYRRDRIDHPSWKALDRRFREEWLTGRERKRRVNRQTEGGPSFYVVRRHRVGRKLVDTTSRMMHAGALTTTRAGQVLGVSPKQVGRMIAKSGT